MTWETDIQDKYIQCFTDINVISVFDSLKYDRSDMDLISPAMRKYVVKKLVASGFKHRWGSVLTHIDHDVKCHIPKSHALGASPFDITRYTTKAEQDFYILTPTQTACQFVDLFDLETAVNRTKQLIEHQPINIFKLKDYLEDKPKHHAFVKAIPHLKYFQREALTSAQLKNKRSLKFFGQA